jgi:hypothetical protein
MESHPQGAAGSTPKGEHPPVSNGRGFAFRNPVKWKTSKCLKIVLSGQAKNPAKSGNPSSLYQRPQDKLMQTYSSFL